MEENRMHVRAPEACTGCRICEMTCSLGKDGGEINPRSSRIRIVDEPEKGRMVPAVCRQCSKAPCIAACRSGALSRHHQSGAIIVDPQECSGCSLCIEACPYGAISLDSEGGTALVCDLCGGSPRCVELCMNHTLLFCSTEDFRQMRARQSADRGRRDPA